MAANTSDSTSPRPGGWLDRLKAMAASIAATETAPPEGAAVKTEPAPSWEVTPSDVPLAMPVDENVPMAFPIEAVPVAEPVADAAATAELPVLPAQEPAEADPIAESLELATADDIPFLSMSEDPAPREVPTTIDLEQQATLESRVILCPVCQSPRTGEQEYCVDCGFYFSPAELAGHSNPGSKPPPSMCRLQNRFELREQIAERQGVERLRGIDHGDDGSSPVPVFIVRQAVELMPATIPVAELKKHMQDATDEFMPTFDEALASGTPATDILPKRTGWPGVFWERGLLQALEQPLLPAVVASFFEDNYDYLVEEIPTGRPLWDAWDDPDVSNDERYGWLVQLAEGLASLHHGGAMLEAIRPELVVVSESGHPRLTEVTDLLPLPIFAGMPVRGTLYTAPELMTGGGGADARAGLYSFGAMLYALHVGRELQEIDFDRPGHPKPFIPRFPDIHPAFGRLLTKTFRREPASRFPTDEAGKEDPTGWIELVRTLNVLRRTMDLVRMEIASWTTTGIVRTGNEDGYALLHACEARQDDLGEQALIILADGMGGYEAGEVAAALAIQVLRQNLLQQKPFAALAGNSPFPTDVLSPAVHAEGHAPEPLDVAVRKQLIRAALKDANKQVFQASRAPGSKRRGMGCTAKVVYLDGRNVVVGHVGDSRTYHLHEGRMVQLTRDQTLVNRLVELGTLTAEEAETHPRRNELQQAVGGQPDVEPGLYHGQLKPGDWVLVCSDGLTNHVSALSLKEMLQSEAPSAEVAARRLVNLTNIEGATDNATVVVVRCT